MPYVVRHLQRMDLTFFAVHSKVIAGRQRGINVDAWIVPYLDVKVPATLTMRYRHVDTGEITTETRPFGKLQKNVRLHGRMVLGEGYSRFGEGDIMLLHFTGGAVTWDILKNGGNQRALYSFLNNPANLTIRRKMGIVLEPGRIRTLEALLTKYDAPLFFAEEIEAIDAEPSSPIVLTLVRRKMSPAAFASLQRSWERNGSAGESFVLERERKRLADAGRQDLADRVKHVASDDATSPYDIHSFEGAGPNAESPRYVEVKSTSGDGMEFEMSEAEWTFAEQHRQQHVLCRVTQVTSVEPACYEIRDIVGVVNSGNAERKPVAFRVKLGTLIHKTVYFC